jgi:hypothetical protein
MSVSIPLGDGFYRTNRPKVGCLIRREYQAGAEMPIGLPFPRNWSRRSGGRLRRALCTELEQDGTDFGRDGL